MAITYGYSQIMVVPGQFDVTSTGAASYRIDIQVPPGSAGMWPELSFVYRSQGSDGIVGLGWSLSGLPSIGRCARTIAQDGVSGGINYDNSDRFCIDGERLVAVSGAYGADGTEYRTEIERFSKIISRGIAGTGSAWFEVRTKGGQIMQLGNSADSRALAAGKSAAHAWAVNNISDTSGNSIGITYTNDAANSQIYPLRINYTSNAAAGLQPYNSVRFVYATRPDIVPLYQAGSLIQLTQRLTKVQVYAEESLVTEYGLTYQQGTATGRSQLTSITQCDGSNVCLPPVSFTWQQGTTVQTVVSNVAGQNGTLSGSRPYVGDFSGDGSPDIVWDAQVQSQPSSTGVRVIWTNTGSGSFVASGNFAGQDGTLSGYAPVLGEFNRDGRSDILWYKTDPACLSCATSSTATTKWISAPNGSFAVSTAPSTTAAIGPSVADANGDNRADVWWKRLQLATTPNGIPLENWFFDLWRISNDGSVQTSTVLTLQGVYLTGTRVYSGDFNGDGKEDVLVSKMPNRTLSAVTANGSGYLPAQSVFLNTGSGEVSSWIANGENDFSYHEPVFVDLNGDGKTDIVWNSVENTTWNMYGPSVARSTGTRIVWLSKGDGTFSVFADPGGTNGTLAGYMPAAGDFNGDGKGDVLWIQIDTNKVSTGSRVLWLSKGDGTFTVVSNFAGQDGNIVGYSPLLADFNGDGKTDVLWDSRSGADTRSTGTRVLWLSDTSAPDLMTGISNGIGATIVVAYKALTDASVYTRDTNATDPLIDLRGPMQVVSRVDASNGIGGNVSSTYTYAGAKADLNGRNFLGFREIAATNLQTNITRKTTYRQDYPYQNRVASETRTRGGVTLSSVAYTYQATSLGATRYDVFLQQKVETAADIDGTALPTLTTTYQYDAYGNATEVAAVASDGFSKTTTHAYTNDVSSWRLGRLTASTVTAQAPMQAGQCSVPWGGVVGDGQSVTAYSAASPPAGQTCGAIAQTRTCINGTLSGSYTQQSCAPSACSLPWGGSIGHGQSVTAYSAASPPAGQACSAIAQTRTCTNGTLSGSYTNQSCVLTDDTPNIYSFTDLSNQSTATVVNSNIVQITGINVAVTATTSGASSQVRSCSDSACSSVINTWASSVSISVNQYLQVRQTTSSAATTTTTATITVGTGTPDTWTATTRAGVTPGAQTFSTPGAFTFTIPNYNNLTVEVWGGGGGGGGYYYPLATGGGQSNWNSSAILANGGKPGPTYGQGESYDANHGYGGTASGGTTNLTGGAAPPGASAGGSSPNGGAQTSGAMQPANPPGGGGSGGGVIGDDWGDGGGGGGYAGRTYAVGAFTPGANISGNVGAGGSAAGADFLPTPGAAGQVRFTWN
ncbi:toxin TcdB middle/N-terminal domain-containing protein [Bradyrhizobium yuanmingense]|uniref:toxin TcdB middle/N-terminal domain-containing protein n=1 Tax=Bradyrhizobium yuanmingense TaxID=108015 RepID=UPI0023B8C503|nr:FG-GAP-like repeat-containing protein [Bradyrhizobium yuanmingense]MDF0584164.1 toxin TcdB middle/N-terminal domain-containing protein [Bradyrhizobium yuanmingense]